MEKTLRAAVCLVLLTHPLVRAQEPAAATPPAAEVGGYRAPLDPAEYHKALSKLPKELIDPVVVAASKFPEWGVRVTSVSEGSQASKAGMVAGSFIHHFNGKEYYYHKQGLDPAPDGRREVAWISPDGVEHTFNFGPGRVGTWSGKGYRPELYVFRNSPRGEWDRDLLIAAVAWHQGDHVLAESGLLRAKTKGLPDSPITTYYQAQLSLDHGDVAGAKKGYAALLAQLPSDKKKISRFYHPGLITLALAFRDFDTLEAVIAEREGMNRELQPATVRKWKAWAAAKPRESLLARALAGAGEELMPKVVKLENDWSGEFQIMDPNPLRNDDEDAWELGPRNYIYRPFAPPTPVHDAIWEVTVALRDIDNQKKSDAPFTFELALVDRPGTSAVATQDPDTQESRRIISMSHNYDSSEERFVRFTGGPVADEEEVEAQPHVPLLRGNRYRDMKKLNLAPEDPHWLKVTLIRLGDEAEILFNGHTVFHIPVDPKAGDLGFYLHSISTSFVVHHMSLRPITAKK